MRSILRKVIIFTIILSILGLIVTISLNTENKSFNTAGNIFSGSNPNHKKTEDKDIELSDDFWTSGRFNF